MNPKKRVLIIRLSALGDVVLTLPLIQNALVNNPDCSFFILTKSNWTPLFNEIEGLNIIKVDFQKEFKGLKGLVRLFFLLRKEYKINIVVDLHNVLRSKILRFLFRCVGAQTSYVSKNRRERKLLTQKNNKHLSPIPDVWTRYGKVFESLGITIDKTFLPRPLRSLPDTVSSFLASLTSRKKILIAPFAAHVWKTYPSEKMLDLLRLLQKESLDILLIGGSKKEIDCINQWIETMGNPKNVFDISKKYTLQEELDIIASCDLALTMDSANLHFAGWVQTPIVSIWGATHPYAGFSVWNNHTVIQQGLNCRPCSIYGNRPCYRGDFACMNLITPEEIAKIIYNQLSL